MIRRAIGWVDDATSGGSSLDTMRTTPSNPDPSEVPAIPDPTQLWPVTNVTVDKGQSNLTREEVRNQIGKVADREFKQAPTVTVQGLLYLPILKKLLKLITPQAPSISGTAPAAITSGYQLAAFGASSLPAVHLALVRDNFYEKVAGCQLGQLTLTFPNEGHATFEAVFGGLWRKQETASFPVLNYAYIGSNLPLLLRDTNLFLGGSTSPTPGFTGYSLVINNALRDPDDNGNGFDGMANRLRVPATASDRERTLWYPARRKLGSQRELTGTVNFTDVKTGQETIADLLRAEQAVFETEGDLLTTTPAARQLFRSTAYAKVLTGGGAGDLSSDDDISSQYDFMAALNSSNQDLLLETVDATA